jgi:hypothetical protein
LKAKNIVDIFDCSKPVVFYDTSTGKYTNYNHGIDLFAYSLKQLQDILGEENVALR